MINDEGVVLAHPRITRKDASRLDRDIKLSELGTGLSEDRINEIIEAGTDPEAVTSTSEVRGANSAFPLAFPFVPPVPRTSCAVFCFACLGHPIWWADPCCER